MTVYDEMVSAYKLSAGISSDHAEQEVMQQIVFNKYRHGAA